MPVPAALPRSGPLLLGVRHHGPGSARAVRAALDAYQAAGRADRGAAGGGRAGRRSPPTRACGRPSPCSPTCVDEPARAAFWPLAEFSPEWVAIRGRLAHGVPVRFIDLPAAHSLALRADERTTRAGPSGGPESAARCVRRPGGGGRR